MAGVAINIVQPSGVTTTWATVINISWQPTLAANVTIGYFMSESVFLSGGAPIATQYFALNISQIDPTQAIPPQLFAQLTAAGAPLFGGTPTS